MSRLVDRFRKAPALVRDLGDPGFGQVFFAAYSSPDMEPIQTTFKAYAEQGFGANAVVFGIISRRMALFSEATFKYQNLTTKKLFGGPELSILENPWPNGTTGELLARYVLDADLAGNAFVRATGDGGLCRLRPDWVIIVSKATLDGEGRELREVIGFSYTKGGPNSGEDPEFYDVSEVAHWAPIPDPMSPWRGMSWLTPVCREVDADSGMTQYKTQYLKNAATPNLVITYDRELSPEAAQKVGAAVQAKHGGVNNSFGTLVLDKGAVATPVGADMKSMDFTKVQAAGENRIAVAGGVPGIVVGLKEGLDAATYSNYAQAMRAFADLTMRPLWRSACASLASLVTVPSGARLWFDTADIAALREGEKDRAETMQVKSAAAFSFIQAGFDPETVAAAIESGDMSQLKHTGRIPVSLYNTDDPPDPAFKKAAPETNPNAQPTAPAAQPTPKEPA